MSKRCEWANCKPLIEYHDNEWGQPVHDDKILFEFLILEGAQAGLSWKTILMKRRGYKEAFKNFNISKVASFTETEVKRLMSNPDIIRNRLKIQSAILSAKIILSLQEEFGSFDKYIWNFIKSKPKVNKFKNLQEVPTATKESKSMSKDMKKRGFTFVGPIICYSFMQAVGMVNDHEVHCLKWKELQ